PVPSVANFDESDAIDVIREEGLTPQISREFDDDVDEGRVIRTDPPAGTEVAPGSTVVVVVSRGPEPTTTTTEETTTTVSLPDLGD
ncbi:MAG: PASTA domain-containing protein, partial [Acidimicrobiales bacterium]